MKREIREWSLMMLRHGIFVISRRTNTFHMYDTELDVFHFPVVFFIHKHLITLIIPGRISTRYLYSNILSILSPRKNIYMIAFQDTNLLSMYSHMSVDRAVISVLVCWYTSSSSSSSSSSMYTSNAIYNME